MAIEPLKKITVIAHGSLEGELVDTLVRLGTVHIEGVIDFDAVSPRDLSAAEDKEARDFSLGVSQIEFLLSFLKTHATEKPGFLKGMIKPKYYLTLDEFMNSNRRLNLGMIYAECQEYEKRFVATREEVGRLEREREELENWRDLEVPLDELKGGLAFGLKTVRIPVRDVPLVEAELDEEVAESALDMVSESGLLANCLLLYLPQLEETVEGVLTRHKVDDITLPDTPLEPEERIEQIGRDIVALERRREEILKRVEGYQRHVSSLEVIREYLANRRVMIEVTTSFGITGRTVMVDGWIPEKSIPETLRLLNEVSDEMSIEVYEPAEEDDPPVSLSNPRWARPFELLVKLFGSPNRHEYDPTVLFAISFSIFFGFCIGDVGYGIALIATFTLLKKYLPLSPKSKDLLTALTYGSAAAIVLGVLTGSWFGIEPEKLPGLLRSLAVLDPLNATLVVMGVCIAIGLVHMLAGTWVELVGNWRDGNRADALIDQGLVFLLFVGGGTALALSMAKVVPFSVFLIILGVTILLMFLLLGRSAKSIPGKLVNGLYETYGTVVGYVSDAISYVRLFALGLATFIIGLVINTMAGLVLGIAPVIGIFLMVLVLVLGHTFNVVINLLGAFVHPLRLEFVEFFGKFYDDGGREFKPFGIDSKIVIIKEEEGA